MALLSVIIPVYNAEKFIRRCLDSLLAQEYGDMEILAVDDGSEDLSGNILDQYGARYSFIHPIHTENAGPMQARLRGLAQAKGQFVAFVDSDDWLEPGMYRQLMAPLLTNSRVDISIGGYMLSYADGRQECTFCGEEEEFSSIDGLRAMFAQKKFLWSLCDKVYRRTLFVAWEPAWFQSSYGEDTEFNWKLFRRARIIHYRPVMGYYYYVHDESFTHRAFSEDWLAYMYRWAKIWDETDPNDWQLRGSLAALMIPFGVKMVWRMAELGQVWSGHIAIFQRLLRRVAGCFQKEWEPRLKMAYGVALQDSKDLNLFFERRENEICKLCRENRTKDGWLFLYGAGEIAKEMSQFLISHDVGFDGFVVTSMEGKTETFCGKPVWDIKTWQRIYPTQGGLLLSVNQSHAEEIQKMLDSLGLRYGNLGRYSMSY